MKTVNSQVKSTHTTMDEACQMMSQTKIDSSDLFSSDSDSSSSDSNSVSISSLTPMGKEEARVYGHHMKLLARSDGQQELGDAATTPIFTMPVLEHVKTHTAKGSETPFAQYGLLGGQANGFPAMADSKALDPKKELDPRVFFNITSPSSTFICGSQGSGKSHTLSCLLENSLFPSPANQLRHPLTGLVFHYDTFISDDGGSPCEAAFLSSSKGVKVRVLCAPTNIATIKVR